MGVLSSSSFFNPHPRTFFFIAFRESGREREKKTSVRDRSIDCLPLICSGTGDQTHNWPGPWVFIL